MPKVGMEPIRRQQLIKATMAAIDEVGLADATVMRIARHAGVSAGIISHYFGGKDGLLEATMRQILSDLGEAVAARRRGAHQHEPQGSHRRHHRRQLRPQPGHRAGGQDLAGVLGQQHAQARAGAPAAGQ